MCDLIRQVDESKSSFNSIHFSCVLIIYRWREAGHRCTLFVLHTTAFYSGGTQGNGAVPSQSAHLFGNPDIHDRMRQLMHEYWFFRVVHVIHPKQVLLTHRRARHRPCPTNSSASIVVRSFTWSHSRRRITFSQKNTRSHDNGNLFFG